VSPIIIRVEGIAPDNTVSFTTDFTLERGEYATIAGGDGSKLSIGIVDELAAWEAELHEGFGDPE
jgi:hypothetical protein